MTLDEGFLRRSGAPAAARERARDAEEGLLFAHKGRFIRTSRTVRVEEFITKLWVWIIPPRTVTPSSRAPLVTPVATKIASERTISCRS